MNIEAIKQKLNALQSTGQKKEKVDYSNTFGNQNKKVNFKSESFLQQ